MLISKVSGFSFPFLLVLINIPFLIWAFWQRGKNFGCLCTISIWGLATTLHFSPHFQVVSDLSLAAVFGGVFLGLGMGLAIRGGAVLDGTEIFALHLNRYTSFSLSDIILVFNTLLFLIASRYLGIEYALYSMVTYWSTAKVVDYIISGIEEYTGMTVISEKNDLIREKIYQSFQRGVTIYQGKGGYNRNDIDIIFCVASQFELPRLRELIHEIDPAAFYFAHHIDDASGGLTKRIIGPAAD